MSELSRGEDRADVTSVESPPTTILGTIRRLGPGLIIAAAIVGSGELIATTKTGAEAGIILLWLIVLGCMIKVFAQVEFGRYSLVTGNTAMTGMNEVPGPRWRVSWLLWYWLIMFVVSLAQLGGIVGGVGQALAMSMPITGDYNTLLESQDHWDRQAAPILKQLKERDAEAVASRNYAARQAALDRVHAEVVEQIGPRPSGSSDDKYWASAVTVITAIMLVYGRYGFVQAASTLMVAAFTFVTIFNVASLQAHAEWSLSAADLAAGFSFQLPTPTDGSMVTPLATALATFGIIGVGATELITYPYWCLEKGYARFTGPRDASAAWAERAKGWMRVMRADAWCSMVIYTFATVAFYLLGATVLHRSGKNPDGSHMIRTLGEMYMPVFGEGAQALFLLGAFAVLYSTFFVAIAGHARTCADAVQLFRTGQGALTEKAYRFWTQVFCAIFPFVSLALYIVIEAPAKMVLASGVMQAIMLPMLGGAALFFRYRRSDDRLATSKLWDLMLWSSVILLLVTGTWTALTVVFPELKFWI